ncbi:hypothetical protein LI328DRAFT_122602 [Trichoderma asperelloides]|nr:hypothetical protein LI328DRAFT_122602 [Trichoderma asperelloides]
MELLEGFTTHISTFHSQSSQIRPRNARPCCTRARQPKVPGGAGTRTAVWRIHSCIAIPGLNSISRLLRRRFQIRPRKFSAEGSQSSSNNSDLAIPRQSSGAR